jgi:type I restriction enzyme M protein
MGTNRWAIEGCQLVEALELYDKYVRYGKTPPEPKHSFSVPADWILALDPRMKRRIQEETTAEFTGKAERERKQLAAKLAVQVKQDKATQRDRDERLAQHDEIWKNKTLNEIAKRIEKAHLYSFNLPNYRSTLSKHQIEEWSAVFNGMKRTNGKTLDGRFAALRDCPLEKAHSALALLDVQNALEFDIARQYLMRFSVEELAKHNQLATLRKIIESGAKYPRVRLGDYLRLNTDRIKPSDFPDTRFRILGVSNSEGVFLNETKPGAEINQAYYRVKPNEFCYNPYRVNVGSIGLNEFDYDNQIISGAYNVFGTDETELLPQFLMALFKSPQFLAYVNEKAHGGVRMNFKFEDLEEWEIPLPSREKQEHFCEHFSKETAVIFHSSELARNFTFDKDIFPNSKRVFLGDIATIERGKFSNRPRNDPRFYGGPYPFIQINDITRETKFIRQYEQTLNEDGLAISRMFPKGSLLMSIASSIGEVGILDFDSCFPDSIVAITPITDRVTSDFLYWY